jgi:hypothetical protein
MRDIILGRKVGSANAGKEKRKADGRGMWAPHPGIPVRYGRTLGREGWYAWATAYESIIARVERVGAKAGD